jgi:hypothetical protein
MNCAVCKHLSEIYQVTQERYVAARNGVFHLVSTELAASRLVDMERAKNDLVEHQGVCEAALPVAEACDGCLICPAPACALALARSSFFAFPEQR